MPDRSPARWTLTALFAAAMLAHAADRLPADNWPQWRGPNGDGVCREAGLPVVWAKGAGVQWRCELPEWGTSTPAVWGNAIFLTSHVDDRQLLLLKIDKQTGRIQWTPTA